MTGGERSHRDSSAGHEPDHQRSPSINETFVPLTPCSKRGHRNDCQQRCTFSGRLTKVEEQDQRWHEDCPAADAEQA